MTAHDDAKIAEILGYSAEVCEPDSKPITAYYTSRHLDPVRKRLVEYVESVRADEREKFCDCPAAFTRYKATHEAEIRERIAQEPCSHDLSMHDAKIRADERERAVADCHADWRIGRAHLRAQVEALRLADFDQVWRSDVLALLGGDR